MSKILKAEDIYKTYRSPSGDVEALRGISLTFEEKLCYAIIGKSGSGKSTLLHVLGCLDRPDAGKVFFEGKDIYGWRDKEQAIFRRRHMGFVFQQFNLVPEYTVRQNITLPIQLDGKRPDDAFYQEVVELLHIADKGEKYPRELSGGEQQRVAIARSIMAKPQIIFADEPTGNLDKKTSDDTVDLLFKTAKRFGQTIILVTHDLEIARNADAVITIQDGKVF